VILYIMCSLFTLFPCYAPVHVPEPVQVVTYTQVQEQGYWGIGQPWVGLTEDDEGVCPGYGMPQGSGARPGLLFPVPGGVVNERRPFSVKHTGVDIIAPTGSAVLAPASGVVIWAGWSTWGFGETVAIAHGGGWYSLLFHLSEVHVACGQSVGQGSMVGKVGETGNVSVGYSHLHFELRNGGYAYSPLQGE